MMVWVNGHHLHLWTWLRHYPAFRCVIMGCMWHVQYGQSLCLLRTLIWSFLCTVNYFHILKAFMWSFLCTVSYIHILNALLLVESTLNSAKPRWGKSLELDGVEWSVPPWIGRSRMKCSSLHKTSNKHTDTAISTDIKQNVSCRCRLICFIFWHWTLGHPSHFFF